LNCSTAAQPRQICVRPPAVIDKLSKKGGNGGTDSPGFRSSPAHGQLTNTPYAACDGPSWKVALQVAWSIATPLR
jgi:hypothetical protein